MVRVLATFLAILAVCQAEAVRLTLIVVDPDGNPIPGAWVDYTGDHPQRLPETNTEGRYSFTTQSPAIVVRKAGYWSERLLTGSMPDGETRVVLKKLPAERIMPLCRDLPKNQETIGISGWESVFRFRKVRGIMPSRQGRDVDFGIRTYRRPGAKDQAVIHGSGPMWSLGSPNPRNLEPSVAFEEASFKLAGRLIIDARGRLAGGTRWRTLAKFGETASYEKANSEDATLFDRFLDGACFAP